MGGGDIEVGRRVVKARKRAGFSSPEKLVAAGFVRERLGAKSLRRVEKGLRALDDDEARALAEFIREQRAELAYVTAGYLAGDEPEPEPGESPLERMERRFEEHAAKVEALIAEQNALLARAVKEAVKTPAEEEGRWAAQAAEAGRRALEPDARTPGSRHRRPER